MLYQHGASRVKSLIGYRVATLVEYTNFHERVFQILRDQIPSLKLTAKAPENGWLEYDRFLLGPGPFSDAGLFTANPNPPADCGLGGLPIASAWGIAG